MKKVTLFKGDGIGPEISKSVIAVFEAMGLDIEFEVLKLGNSSMIRKEYCFPKNLSSQCAEIKLH